MLLKPLHRALLVGFGWPLSALLVFYLGRWTAPTKTVDRFVQVDSGRERIVYKLVQDQAKTTATVKDQGKVVTRWKRVVTPAGPCVEEGERIEDKDRERTGERTVNRNESTAAKSTERVRYVDRTKEVQTFRNTQPRFAGDLMFGLDGNGTRYYGGSASVRALGPASIGAWTLNPHKQERIIGVQAGWRW